MFQHKARATLGNQKYLELVEIARDEFKKAWLNSNDTQRENNARRAANSVFSKKM